MCCHCDPDIRQSTLTRRTVLGAAVALAGVVVAPASWGRQARSLSFYHTHTGERLQVTYAEQGTYVRPALSDINRLLRDFRTGDVHPIAPDLLDALFVLRERVGGRGTYEIISAYRSPRTNEMLRNASSGVAQRSLHMEGRAIDVRLTGVRSARLRDEAKALEVGGVGYYGSSDFVHVDNGRVRFW
jgi:uncharacterized protein YcbK (DUF882 family)